MAATTNLTPAAPPQPETRGKNRLVQLGIDVPLFLAVITLLVFGALMVYSASYDYSLRYSENNDPLYIFERQLLWMGLGLFSMVFFTFFRYEFWRKLAFLGLLVTIVLLILVLMFGEIRNNAQRTLLSGSLQPSELAKVVTIIYLAAWLYSKRDFVQNVLAGLVPIAVILGVQAVLIWEQPDYSTVMTLMAMGGIMLFMGGASWKQIFIALVGSILVGYGIATFTQTGQTRVDQFVSTMQNPLDAPDQVRRFFEAFILGGWFGVGLGNSTLKVTTLSFPHTDSIFAIIGEELGIVGCLILMTLYAIIFWRGAAIARRAPDTMGSLLAIGLTSWIVMEAALNIMFVVGLMPVSGNALPLISAGGSSMLVVMTALGIVQNVSLTSYREEQKAQSSLKPVVNLHRYQTRSTARRQALDMASRRRNP